VALTITLYQAGYNSEDAALVMKALEIIRREYGIIIYLDIINQSLTSIGVYEEAPKISLGDKIITIKNGAFHDKENAVEEIVSAILRLLAGIGSEDEGGELVYKGDEPSGLYIARHESKAF